MLAYDKGDVRKITATFTNSSGTATDPTEVYFDVVDPASTLTTYQYGVDAEVIKDSTGVYYIDLNLSVDGHYVVQWRGTGDITTVGRYELYARRGI